MGQKARFFRFFVFIAKRLQVEVEEGSLGQIYTQQSFKAWKELSFPQSLSFIRCLDREIWCFKVGACVLVHTGAELPLKNIKIGSLTSGKSCRIYDVFCQNCFFFFFTFRRSSLLLLYLGKNDRTSESRGRYGPHRKVWCPMTSSVSSESNRKFLRKPGM